MPTSCVRETCHFEVTSAAAAAAAVAVVVGFVFVLHHDVVRSDSVFYRNEHGLIILEWFQTCSVSCEACKQQTVSYVRDAAERCCCAVNIWHRITLNSTLVNNNILGQRYALE